MGCGLSQAGAGSVHSWGSICLFFDPMDSLMPGSSVHGILQAKTLQWVAISSSRGSSRPRDRTAWAGRFFTSEPPGRLDGVAVTFGSQAVPRARRLCLDPGGGPHAGGRVDGGGWGPGSPGREASFTQEERPSHTSALPAWVPLCHHLAQVPWLEASSHHRVGVVRRRPGSGSWSRGSL